MFSKSCLSLGLSVFLVPLGIMFVSTAPAEELDVVSLQLPGPGNTFSFELNNGFYYTSSNFNRFLDTEPLSESHAGWQNDGDTAYDLLFDHMDPGPSGRGKKSRFHYFDFSLKFGYSVKRWFELEAFLKGKWHAKARDFSGRKEKSPHLTRGGFGFMGYRLFPGTHFGFNPEITFSVPFKTISPHDIDGPATDDGSIHFTPALWFYFPLLDETVYPFLQMAIKLRTHNLSSFFKWRGGLMIDTGPVDIGMNALGFWPIILDSSSGRGGDRVHYLLNNNAGSLKFYAPNPKLLLAIAPWVTLHISRMFWLKLDGTLDLIGRDYAKGYRIAFTFGTRFGPGLYEYTDRVLPSSGEEDHFHPAQFKQQKRFEKEFKKSYQAYPELLPEAPEMDSD